MLKVNETFREFAAKCNSEMSGRLCRNTQRAEWVACEKRRCPRIVKERGDSKNSSASPVQQQKDVICSDSMCDYCTKIETCNGFEDAGDCFNGRKLTPVL